MVEAAPSREAPLDCDAILGHFCGHKLMVVDGQGRLNCDGETDRNRHDRSKRRESECYSAWAWGGFSLYSPASTRQPELNSTGSNSNSAHAPIGHFVWKSGAFGFPPHIISKWYLKLSSKCNSHLQSQLSTMRWCFSWLIVPLLPLSSINLHSSKFDTTSHPHLVSRWSVHTSRR